LVVGEIEADLGRIRLFEDEAPYLAGRPTRDRVQLLTATPMSGHSGVMGAMPVAREESGKVQEIVQWLGLGRGLDSSSGDRVLLGPVEGDPDPSPADLQKWALAGPLATPPALLILDEATSRLPPDEEVVLMERLKARFGGSILIVLTHNLRLTSIASVHVAFSGGDGALAIDDRRGGGR
jgi:ABC-type transport system involved in cytochrome bd biosynthesis fused ATPase/permease subunit